jgi:putative ABC transport system permease protein
MIPVSYNVRNLRSARPPPSAAVLGLALVVFVFAGTLMLANGIDRTLGRSAASDAAVVLRKGRHLRDGERDRGPSVNLVLNDTTLAQAGQRPRGSPSWWW